MTDAMIDPAKVQALIEQATTELNRDPQPPRHKPIQLQDQAQAPEWSERERGGSLTRCHANGEAIIVPGDIVRCTDYVDKRHVSRWELEKIAWVIRHDRSVKIRGFEPPPKEKARL